MKKNYYLCFILALAMLTPAFSSAVYAQEQSEDAEYISQLEAAGFPSDYAEKLLALHKKHPLWVFEPLDVTGLSDGVYTWDYIMYQECDKEVNRNLVSAGDSYITLRDMSNTTLYDSGWYKASRAAVEYMMDPRNFMDEKQIFQFYSLSWSDSVTLSAVEAALSGTFMANAKLDGEYSELTYAEYFMQLGKELGANPVYLASRVRNEQGTAGGSPLINGKCGDKLWYYYSNKITGSENGHLIAAPGSGYTESQLKAYNGYYNYFNIGAAGTGYFQIYLGGMNEAKTGTASKAAEWGGSGSWNTIWKSLYGGAYKATNTYINDYQNTPYLQKFNVDPRSSRNFWGQYMQSIHGSVGMATNFYNSFKQNKMLDLPYTFSIPVYKGIPAECPYPDGTGISDTSYLTKDNVASYDVISIESLQGQSGVVKKWASAKISWRVYVGSKGSTLDLGTINLSKYDYALIEYSVSDSFDFAACGTRSVIGFVSDAEHPYGGEGEEADMTSSLGSRRMENGSGWLQRHIAYVSLEESSYIGNVYLTSYTQKSQKYVVHNIIFVTKTDHTGTIEETAEPQTTDTAAETPALSETTSEDISATEAETISGADGSGKNTAVVIILITVVVALAAVLTFVILKKPKASDEAPRG